MAWSNLNGAVGWAGGDRVGISTHEDGRVGLEAGGSHTSSKLYSSSDRGKFGTVTLLAKSINQLPSIAPCDLGVAKTRSIDPQRVRNVFPKRMPPLKHIAENDEQQRRSTPDAGEHRG